MPLGPDGLEGFISISSFVTQPVSACNVHLDRKHTPWGLEICCYRLDLPM